MAQPERRLAGDARPPARRRPLPRPAGDRRRRGAAAAGAGDGQPRPVQPAGVGRRSGVRPRLPHPAHRPPGARRRAPAPRPDLGDLPGPLRPHPAAVDVLRHRGRGGRPRRAGVEDPSHGRRRHRCRPPRRGLPPADPRPCRPAAGRSRRHRRPLRRPASRAAPTSLDCSRPRHCDPHGASTGGDRPAHARRGGDVGC